MSLELAAMRWLRFERRCKVVLFERTPRVAWGGRPDVIGVDNSRRLVEIECKRSAADFRNNQFKTHVVNRHLFLDRWPYQFYFLIPGELWKLESELPGYAGLMILSGFDLFIKKPAPVNKKSSRLSFKECVELAKLMANQVCATEFRAQGNLHNFRHGHEPYGIEYQI